MCRFTLGLGVGLVLALLAAPQRALSALPADQVSLQKCQQTVGKEGEKYIRGRGKAIATCLKRISVEVIRKGGSDVSRAAKTCVAQFRKLNDSRTTKADIGEKFLAKVQSKCDPANHSHTLADILGTGAGVPESIQAENLNAWCQNFGGDGSIGSLNEWLDCIVTAHTCEGDQAISVQYPRVLEWLDNVKPSMQAITPPATDPDKVNDALAALDALDQSLDSDMDDVLDITCGPAGRGTFPASGQTTSYVMSDDGDIRAGAALSYTDNGDGTITDRNTGLMWEKKVGLDSVVDPNNSHDADNCYPWGGLCTLSTTVCGTDGDCPEATTCDAADCQNTSPNGLTIFEWVEQLNNSAFAGHTDWRVANYKELVSILDLEQSNPAVSSAFHGVNCGGVCTDLADPLCSCTVSDFYWSSTTVPPGPSLAWLVVFDDGDMFPAVKTFNGWFVRAVRGP